MTTPTSLALTPDQQLIRDAAESFLSDVCPSAAVRRAMDGPDGHDAPVWERIAGELGWCGIAIDESLGGLGLGAVELALVFEQAGRRLLCSPLFATVGLAVPLLQAPARCSRPWGWPCRCSRRRAERTTDPRPTRFGGSRRARCAAR